MGVVHKLKQEIIQFIVQAKRDNPAAGCRQLAQSTSEKFSIKVSKSSINNILKSSNLSSSVGRRSTGGVKKKFEIPQFRKKQLFSEVLPEELDSKSSEETKPIGTKKEMEAVPEEKDGKAAEQIEGGDLRSQGNKKDPVEMKETPMEISNGEQETMFPKEFLREIEILKEKRKQSRGPVYEGMGMIFLKAAFGQLCKENFLGSFFKKIVTKTPFSQFDAFCNAVFFLEFLEERNFKDLLSYKNHALWLLSGCTAKSNLPPDLIEEDLMKFSMTDSLSYSQKRDQLFVEVAGYKIYLENGESLFTDARLTFLTEKIDLKGNTAPLHQALQNLSYFFISNNESCMFFPIEHRNNSFNKNELWVSVCENDPGSAVEKVGVLDTEGNEIVCFTIIPKKKRKFLLGIESHQKEFSALTKTVKWASKTPFYHEILDEKFLFAEMKTDYYKTPKNDVSRDLRVITIWSKQRESPFLAILTNDCASLSSQIVRSYLLHYPQLNQSDADASTEKEILASSDIAKDASIKEKEGFEECVNADFYNDYHEIFLDLGSRLHAYCQKEFLLGDLQKVDLQNILPLLYGLRGHHQRFEDAIVVTLLLPKDYAYRQDLRESVEKFNSVRIVDNKWRRIFVFIE